jgi:hypothetical protein
MPSPLTGFAFGLAAMAPLMAITFIALATLPRWRGLGVRGLTFALAGGVGCLLLWFVVYHRALAFEWYPALVALGAGFSAGGLITILVLRPWSTL